MKLFQKVGGEACGIKVPHSHKFPHISFKVSAAKDVHVRGMISINGF
jgi:hypothetical protein